MATIIDKNYTDFDDITVSTQTVIAVTNLIINTDILYTILPVSDYMVHTKRRGRKKKCDPDVKPDVLDDGCIITVKNGENMRGIDAKPRKKNAKFFRNALTCVMFMEDKLLNIKICKNGKLQFTGCKNSAQPQKCIRVLWRHMQNHTGVYTFSESMSTPTLEVKLLTVMTNIDFNVGFAVNREKLDMYVNDTTAYNSLLETSFGYTGTNIRIRVDDATDYHIPTMTCKGEDDWTVGHVPFSVHVDSLTVPEQTKVLAKVHYNTFLVFHSGSVIMSSTHLAHMKAGYTMFREMINSCRPLIEEKACL